MKEAKGIAILSAKSLPVNIASDGSISLIRASLSRLKSECSDTKAIGIVRGYFDGDYGLPDACC